MPRVRHLAWLVVLVAGVSATTLTQVPPLAVTGAYPQGVLAQPGDAAELRLVFSAPMVSIGGADVTTAPPWLTIEPAIDAAYYWSGTRTLIVTPDPDAPMPRSTRFVIRVAGTATSVNGQVLGRGFESTFTTPTTRLESVNWYRRDGRFDSPAVLALRFNQPVRAADVLAHTSVSYQPHDWDPPTLSASARRRLSEQDPAAVAAFDAKVARTGAATRATDRISARLAPSWDTERYPESPDLVVLETIDVPPTDSWLAVAIDDRMPGAEGPVSHAAHESVVQLEPTFFATISCERDCYPGTARMQLTSTVSRDGLVEALEVVALDGDAEPRISKTDTRPLPDPIRRFWAMAPADLGYPVQPPVSIRVVSLDPFLRASDGQVLGYRWTAVVETTHLSPVLAIPGALWEASNGPRLPLISRNVAGFVEQVDRLALDALLPELQRGSSWVPRVSERSNRRRIAPEYDVPQLVPLDLSGMLTPQGTGLVWARVASADPLPGAVAQDRSPDRSSGAVIQVTNLGLTVKTTGSGTTAWVTELASGQPVPRARVRMVDDANRVAWQGTTGADGAARAAGVALIGRFVVTAERDGDIAFTSWQPQLGRAGRSPGSAFAGLTGAVFTDRGVYQQGQEVTFKAVLRRQAVDGLRTLDPEDRVHIRIMGPRGEIVYEDEVTAGQWSAPDSMWAVPEDAPLGRYNLVVGRQVGQRGRTFVEGPATTFQVAAFRPPDFRVDAGLTATTPILGEMLTANVDARYLFGSPLAGRDVRWRVWAAAFADVPQAVSNRFPPELVAFGYRATEGLPPSSGTGTLDDDGTLRIDVATQPDSDGAWRYHFSGEVESASAQFIADQAVIDVHPAALYAGIEHPRGFVEAESGGDFRIHVVDLEGVDRVGSAMRVELARQEWKPAPATRPGQPWEQVDVPVADWELTSAVGGVPLHVVPETGGSHVIRAFVTDEHGRTSRTEWPFYATGNGARWWSRDPNTITLVPERDVWAPGDTARLLVQSPWNRARALVTVEREDVRRSWYEDLESSASTIDIPILDDDVPNVQVSVVLIKGRTERLDGEDPDADAEKPGVRIGQQMLRVDAASRRLDVAVGADRETYGPGDEAQVDVAVSHRDAGPLRSEVALWAVDHALLSLTDYQVPDLVDRIYRDWPVYVTTYDNRLNVIGRPSLAPGDSRDPWSVEGATITAMAYTGMDAGLAFGGGGGGGRGVGGGIAARAMAPPPPATPGPPSGAEPQAAARADFRSLVFWLGSVETDAAGRATTTVTLPDSLTTYRIMAVASDGESRFGGAEHEIRATKPLAMLPAFPRFMAVGDRGSFSVTVTSAEAGAGEATVTINSLDTASLSFETMTQTVAVAAGETVPVRFSARALGRGPARVRVDVSLNGVTDAFETAIPVVQPLRRVVTAAYGDTLDRADERIELPPAATTGRGLTIDLASTALVGLGGGARYLLDYPYECAEQKASRSLAMWLDAELDGAFGLDAGAGDARARALAGVSELFAFQCASSGGFSLWPGQCGSVSPYLTAYIVHVMQVAGVASSDDYRIQSALSYLERHLEEPPPAVNWWPAWAASQAFAVKVLTAGGRRPAEHIERLFGAADRMPVFALSYLADAIGSTGKGPRYQAVVQRIQNATRVEADRAFVQELEDPSLLWLWNSNVRATAAVLEGLARRGDAADLAAPMARWLLAVREDGRWGTTHENATALEALAGYFRALEPVEPDMTASVSVGDQMVGEERFEGRADATRTLQIALPELAGRLGADRAANLAVAKTGDGRLYYTARLEYLEPVPVSAERRGMQVDRRYETYVPDDAGDPATSFALGDVVRVRLTLTLPREGRFLAVTDSLPAGFEPVDASFKTTASDLAREATRQSSGRSYLAWWRNGGFDHIEKHDDRVVAYATRLAPGRHEFTYLVRATTAGEFTAAGVLAEAMYAPEVNGRGSATTVIVRD